MRVKLVFSVAAAVAGIVAAVLLSTSAGAFPVPVRFTEGAAHGFLLLRSTEGQILAHGDWWQVPQGERVETHLVFRFRDGSVSDETIVYSQRQVFRLLSYRLAQRGPSFPRPLDVAVNTETGRFTVRFREKPEREEEGEEGKLDLPEDVYTGMLPVLLKNVRGGEGFTGHFLVFTPKPRVLPMEVTPAGEDTFRIGGVSRRATRYAVKPELTGLAGLLAPVVGKEPPTLYYWTAGDPVPGFVRFEGPLYANGPRWRIELTSPRWPDDSRDNANRPRQPSTGR